MDDRSGTERHRANRLVLLLLGGWLIGLTASLPLAVAWPHAMSAPADACLHGSETNPIDRIRLAGIVLPLPCMPTILFIQPPMWGGFLGAGIVFGLIAGKLAESRSGRDSQRLLAALGGFSLLVMSYLGSLLVPRISGLAVSRILSNGVAEPFALMIFGISFVFALALGLALRTPGLLWRALVSAAATAACHWFVIWVLLGDPAMIWGQDTATAPLAHSLPHLGNEMGPMLRTMLISNLISGTIGGYVTLALLTVRRPPPPSAHLPLLKMTIKSEKSSPR
jgi:hypothetical protein